MIRHVAVRQNCKLALDRGTQKLIVYGADYCVLDKVAIPVERTDREEILLWAGVRVVIEAARTHGECKASVAPGHP